MHRSWIKARITAKRSTSDRCICDMCHDMRQVTKITYPWTKYHDKKQLSQKKREIWICDNCRQELENALGMTEWQKCSEHLPEWSGRYLVTYSDTTVHECYFGRGRNELKGHWALTYADSEDDIIAWASMPSGYEFWENNDVQKE